MVLPFSDAGPSPLLNKMDVCFYGWTLAKTMHGFLGEQKGARRSARVDATTKRWGSSLSLALKPKYCITIKGNHHKRFWLYEDQGKEEVKKYRKEVFKQNFKSITQ